MFLPAVKSVAEFVELVLAFKRQYFGPDGGKPAWFWSFVARLICPRKSLLGTVCDMPYVPPIFLLILFLATRFDAFAHAHRGAIHV